MTGGEPQIWLATAGGDMWGGAEVWISTDGDSYTRIGATNKKARFGSLSAPLASGAVFDRANTLNVEISAGQMTGGTEQDSRDLLTLCYVDGEFLAYETAELKGVGRYTLGNLTRGAYGSTIDRHNAGSQFVRIDEAMFKYAVPANWVGRTVWVKLVSFNVFGSGVQELAEVPAYSYTIKGAPLGQIQNLRLTSSWAYGKEAVIAWDKLGGADTYDVEVYAGNTQKRLRSLSGIVDNGFTYTQADMKADGGQVRDVVFKVRGRAVTGKTGNWAQVAAQNPQLKPLQGIEVDSGLRQAFFKCAMPSEEDFAGIVIWVSENQAVPTIDTNKAYDGAETFVPIIKCNGKDLQQGKTYYLRAAGYDSFGKDGMSVSNSIAFTVADVSVTDLTESNLNKSLRDKIALIDGNGAGSVNARIEAETRERVSKIEQVSSKLNNLSVGGRNLIRDSATQVQNSNYLIQSYQMTDNSLQEGEPVTVTIWGDLGSDREAFWPFNSNGFNWLGAMKKVSDGVYQLSATWKRSQNNPSNDRLLIYCGPNSGRTASRIDRIKLERGTVATDWTPAPEDNTAVVQTHAQSINGLEAQYTVKVDVNGKVAGYGLATTPKNGTPESKFIVNADRFGVGSTGKADIFPFTVDTRQNRVGVNGELVVNGKAIIDKLNVGDIHGDKITANTLNANRLTAGSVTAREMAAGSITADKLAAGSITADKLAANSVTSEKLSVQNLSSVSSDLGDIRAGNINIGNGAFTVSSGGDLYAKNGRFEGTVYADKIEGDVLKFFQFQRNGVGRFSLRYHNNGSKTVMLSLQNLSFTTPDSKSSYWVSIRVNNSVVVNKECWSIYTYASETGPGGTLEDRYKGVFYNIPYVLSVDSGQVVDISIEINHELSKYRTSTTEPVDIDGHPYVLAARI